MKVTLFEKPNGRQNEIDICNVRQADVLFFTSNNVKISMEDSGVPGMGATVYADIGKRADDGTPEEIIVFARGRTCEDTFTDLRQKCDRVLHNSHTLYKEGDTDVPDAIKDRNGDIVLGQCRLCGRAEIELSSLCPGASQ